MLYVIHCFDKKNSLHIRTENRPDHVEYLKSFSEKLIAAGPTLDKNETMNGSVIIIELENQAELEQFTAGDPYAKAGLFEKVITSPWKKVLP